MPTCQVIGCYYVGMERWEGCPCMKREIYQPAPLSAEDVRKIVREELERAGVRRKPWQSGKMGPG
jgi:hypothetical protein